MGVTLFKDLRYTLCRRYIVASRRAARIIVYALESQNKDSLLHLKTWMSAEFIWITGLGGEIARTKVS
jgi:hypothetical protein